MIQREDVFAVELQGVPRFDTSARAVGSFRVARVEGGRIELQERGSVVAGLAFLALSLATVAVAAALLRSLGPAVGAPLALPTLGLGLWALLCALRSFLPPVLRVDTSAGQVSGRPLGAWLPRQVSGSVLAVDAVTVEVRQVRPPSGTGQHSFARLELTRKDGAAPLEGPKSEERAEAAWEACRDELLPLALELAKRLGRPARVRYVGFRDHLEPVVREVSGRAG